MTLKSFGLLVGVLTLAFPAVSGAQMVTLGEVMVFHVPDIKPDADLRAMEAYVIGLVPRWSQAAPATTMKLVKKDRGPHAGSYMIVWTTRTAAAHEALRSSSGAFPFNAATLAAAGDFREGLARFVNGPGRYIEYRLVAPDRVGAALPTVDVLGNHYTRVQPNRVAAFDQFVSTRLQAAVGNLRPDLRLLYYRPVRGADPGEYLTLIALTKASRDKYWPKGADSADVKAAFAAPLPALATELQSFLVDGTWGTGMAAAVYEAKDWADWIFLN